MAILRYEELSFSDLQSIPRDRAVVFLPVGPLEQHGPHLPLGLDAMTARFLGEKMAERLEKKYTDWTFVLFPTIYAGTDTLAHTGTIEIPPSTLRTLLYSNCRHLAKAGFKNLVLVGGHGGPRHMVVLEEVSTKMRWRHGARVISASAKIFEDLIRGSFHKKLATHNSLSDEAKSALSTDFHGGLFETSLMLVAHPHLVKPTFRAMTPAKLTSVWKIRKKSTQKTGPGLGYLGSPALASKEIGEAAIQQVLDQIQPDLEKFLKGENVNPRFRSFFYFIPFLRTDFRWILILAFYIFVFGIAFQFINRNLLEFYR